MQNPQLGGHEENNRCCRKTYIEKHEMNKSYCQLKGREEKV